MRFIREFAVVCVLWIVCVRCIENTSTSPRKCVTITKHPIPACVLCLESGIHAKDRALFFSDTYAPAHCTSGIIEWHYPFGNGRVHFPINITGRETVSICLQNWERIGSRLIFHDITGKESVPFSICTKSYKVSGEVVVQVSGIGGQFTPVGMGENSVYLQMANYTINTYRRKGNSGN